MNETCNDNRFELIERAKKDLLENTNIDTNPDELKVLDNFLFRCWQMGWLERYNDERKWYSIEKLINDLELINNAVINLSWYLTDLPNKKFSKIKDYLTEYSGDLDNISNKLEKMCESLEKYRGE